MAIARLLVAGVMVAGGLVLGAFAALGYLDPNWTQNQLASASKRETGAAPKSISAFRRTRFVATESEAPQRKVPVVKASNDAEGCGGVAGRAEAYRQDGSAEEARGEAGQGGRAATPAATASRRLPVAVEAVRQLGR